MSKQILKSGTTKRVRSSFKKASEDKVKEVIQLFKSVKPLDYEEILEDAEECFKQHYTEAYEYGLFDEQYLGSFDSILDVGKYLLAQSEDSGFINDYPDYKVYKIVRTPDSISLGYISYLQNAPHNTIDIYEDSNNTFHIFSED